MTIMNGKKSSDNFTWFGIVLGRFVHQFKQIKWKKSKNRLCKQYYDFIFICHINKSNTDFNFYQKSRL